MSETNIYTPPITDVSLDPVGSKLILKELKNQSTWRLFFLTVVTFGVYSAHYIRRQTNILNKSLSEDDQISSWFIGAILFLSYASLALLVPSLLAENGHDIEGVANSLDRIGNIAFVIWAFKARNRMNTILQSVSGSRNWFHGLWTFLFGVMYFNYKVNKLNEEA